MSIAAIDTKSNTTMKKIEITSIDGANYTMELIQEDGITKAFVNGVLFTPYYKYKEFCFLPNSYEVKRIYVTEATMRNFYLSAYPENTLKTMIKRIVDKVELNFRYATYCNRIFETWEMGDGSLKVFSQDRSLDEPRCVNQDTFKNTFCVHKI